MSRAANSKEFTVVSSQSHEYVTVVLDGQLLGVPVLAVHDVLSPQKITSIPRAPAWIAGVLNLRGRIVTAISLRKRLGLGPRTDGGKDMSIVVEHRGEPYSLQIDKVGEVLSLDEKDFERNPVTLDPVWKEISSGIFRLDGELLVILDVSKMLASETAKAA